MNNRNITKKCRGGGFNGHKIYEKVISLENLFSAWEEFKKGKEKKKDVLEFTLSLEDNIFALHRELSNNKYQHSHYTSFHVHDPKLRYIHKAKVKDRVLHHAIVKIIEPIFEKTFIFYSYSSRKDKGTHKAVKRLKKFAWKLSCNNTKTVWVLKGDIKKFFDSVDHGVLLELLEKNICDEKAVKLVEDIIYSFQVDNKKGIPLGNLTSQLFSNVYLNELDQFVKQELKVKYYIRYADDFIILNRNKIYLQNILICIQKFLKDKLELKLHERKVSIKKWHKGTDFLGYVVFPHHIILRTKTKKRILKKLKRKQWEMVNGIMGKEKFEQIRQSYLGVLKHCWGNKIKKKMKN